MYKVRAYLAEHPNNPDGEMLRDQIQSAVAYERQVRAAPRAGLEPIRLKIVSCIALILIFVLLLTIAFYLYKQVGRLRGPETSSVPFPRQEQKKAEAPRPVPPPQKPAILAGYIIDAETREPLAGVTLTIQDWETIDGRSPTATTDAAGRFRFDNLRPSADVSQQVQQVRLIAHKPGYKAYTTDTPLGSTTLPIKLRPTTTSEAKR